MPLPKLAGLSALRLLRIADDTVNNVKMMMGFRVIDEKPMTPRLLPDEIVWCAELAMTGGIIKEMLDDLDVSDIARAWAAKHKHKKDRGRQTDFIYDLAFSVLNSVPYEPMGVYRDIVLPALIELERIQVDDRGEPDPYQDTIEQKNFLKAMARRRKTPRK